MAFTIDGDNTRNSLYPRSTQGRIVKHLAARKDRHLGKSCTGFSTCNITARSGRHEPILRYAWLILLMLLYQVNGMASSQ
jgi:hypothetical protein